MRRAKPLPPTAALPPEPSREAGRWWTAAWMAAILAAGMLAYLPSFKGLFVLDEASAIVGNPSIRSLKTAFTAPPEVGLGGRPFASLSFALNYALAPADARDAFTPPPPASPPEAWDLLYRNLSGYHGANLAIHLMTALAAFGIVRRTLSAPRFPACGHGAATHLAGVTALLWVVHPLHTSAVTYVAQRVESQMGMFYLLSVYCAIRASASADGQAASARSTPRAWIAASVAACVLGAGSKEVTVTLPFVMLAYDAVFLYPPPMSVREVWRRRWPVYAGLGAVWLLTAALVLTAPRAASVGFGLGWTPWVYLQTQAGILVHYARLVVVPWPLVLDYEWPPARHLREVWPYALPVVSAVVATAWGLWRRHPLAFVGAWCFLILAPSSSVLPIVTEVAAEHRMYLPLLAILAAIVAGTWHLTRRWAGRPWRIPALAAIVMLAASGSTVLTRTRNLDYQDEERLWAQTVAERPRNSRALANLGVVLIGKGRASEAEPYIRRALDVRPDYPEALSALGAVLASRGETRQALPLFERAVALEPSYADAWANYAEALAASGRQADSLAARRRVLALKPESVRAQAAAAWILATAGDDRLWNPAAALTLASRAAELSNGRDVQALDALGVALAALGRFDEAAAAAARAEAAARAAGLADLAAAIGDRQRAYRSGAAYRER